MLSRHVLQSAHILPGVGAIFGSQPLEAITIETERRVFVHPVWTIASIHFVIVQMQVENVHFIPRQHFHVVFQGADGKKLSCNVKHKTAYFIFWIISRHPPANMYSCGVLQQDLQCSAGTIEDTCARMRADDYAVPHLKEIPFVANYRVPIS